MTERHAESVAVIGGADGPTSVFVTGKKTKKTLKHRIKLFIRKCKRNRAEKKITAGTHTADEVVAYAVKKYSAVESDSGCIIKTDENCFEIDIDREKELFGVSFSGNKKAMKDFRKIAVDLYLYYGVSEKDIIEKSERYLSLLTVLSM